MKYEEDVQLLPHDDLQLRVARVTEYMRREGMDAVLLCDNANIFYMTGRVFCGYVYVCADGTLRYFVRRPSTLRGEGIEHTSRPSDIAAMISPMNVLGLELDTMPYRRAASMAACFPGVEIANASAIMAHAKAVKTPLEISMMKESGTKQTRVYERIPRLYQRGMSDVEFQIEIERALRLEGCLGIFRVTGPDLELFMGNVLTGENADRPSPYDFAMGGAGVSPSLPVGADGTIIKPGKPVMVDVNGNFNGYMTDMTRCYVTGEPSAEARHALDTSRAICRRVAQMAVPGALAKDLYDEAVKMAEDAGLADAFMGHRYHAGFVGHGLGISVNELPVLSPRSKDIIEAGNAIAVEPKFVIPGLGAIGIENTYIVKPQGPAECITLADENFVSLD